MWSFSVILLVFGCSAVFHNMAGVSHHVSQSRVFPINATLLYLLNNIWSETRYEGGVSGAVFSVCFQWVAILYRKCRGVLPSLNLLLTVEGVHLVPSECLWQSRVVNQGGASWACHLYHWQIDNFRCNLRQAGNLVLI